jgi:Na+/melibiose symporter-like transporter
MINNKKLISYSLLGFCLAFMGLPLYIYLPNYYHDNFNISLQNIAIIIFATRLIDTIQDPIFGFFSDKYSHLKRNIIFYLSPLMGLSFLLLFYPLNIINIHLWLIITLIITFSLFSVVYINYQSYAVAFSDDYHIKTKIIAYREVSFISGIIFAALIPALLFKIFDERFSFFIVGITYFILASLFAVIFYFFAPKNDYSQNQKGNFKEIFSNKLLRKFSAVFLLNAISAAIPAVLIMFFVEKILNAKDLVGIFLLLYFGGLMIGTILWSKLSKILNNKAKTWLIAIFLTVFIFIFCYFLGEGDILYYAIICVLSGIAFGGDFALSFSILTDIIQKDKLQNNQTIIFGFCNFMIKISLTLSSSILIYFIGFFENNIQLQSEFISFSYALLPIIFRILAGVILYRNFKY